MQEDVAQRMVDLGWSWVRSTVAKIEHGQRAVNTDELVSLAYVLGVSPAALLVATDGNQQVGPTVSTTVEKMWHWMTGARSMGGARIGRRKHVPSEERPPGSDRFHLEACPDFVVAAETRLPGVRNLMSVVAQVQEFAGVAGDEDSDRILSAVSERLHHLQTEVAVMRARVDMLRGDDNWMAALNEPIGNTRSEQKADQ